MLFGVKALERFPQQGQAITRNTQTGILDQRLDEVPLAPARNFNPGHPVSLGEAERITYDLAKNQLYYGSVRHYRRNCPRQFHTFLSQAKAGQLLFHDSLQNIRQIKQFQARRTQTETGVVRQTVQLTVENPTRLNHLALEFTRPRAQHFPLFQIMPESKDWT